MKPINYEQVRKYMEAPAESLHIKPASEFLNPVLARIEGKKDDVLGDCFPWQRSYRQFQMRKSELSIWTGFNGHYKSMILNYIMMPSRH